MGMFDKPQFLTGKSETAYVQPGDTFWLHAARIDGTSNINGTVRDQAKLKVSHTKNGDTTIVYTSGAGVVGQIKRIDDSDRSAMPMEVRLDAIPSNKGNPTHVITPADQPAPTATSDDGDIPF